MEMKIDRYRQFFVFVLLCMVSFPAYLSGGASNIRFKRFSLEQGFFHNRVQCIIQDRQSLDEHQ
ncbi:MAG: hypothetical protein GY950_01710 [bacterium]|nr:hypothetical protein [bacterium]